MLDKTIQDWNSEAASLEIEGRAFINGRYEQALGGETRATINPANGQKLADKVRERDQARGHSA